MIPHNKLVLTIEDRAAVDRVLASGHVAQGLEVQALERELTERFRPNGDCVVVSSGTAALYLAMDHLTPMPEFKMTTYTCSAALHAAEMSCQGQPTLLDVEESTLHASGADLTEHTYGLIDRTLSLIEDFTHAPVPGKVGTFGSMSVVSFGATKPLSAGAGGAVLGPKDVIEEIRDKRDYDGKPTHRERFNWQLSDVHATLCRQKLLRLDQDNARRREIAERYFACFSQVVSFAPRECHYRFTIASNTGSPSADEMISWMESRGVQCICPLTTRELLHRRLGMEPRNFPVAERVAKSVMSIPIWTGMSEEQVQQVCRAIFEMLS